MFYKKVIDEQGVYADASGVRYDICAARRIRTAPGRRNDAYEYFSSLDDALETWGLSPIAGGFSSESIQY